MWWRALASEHAHRDGRNGQLKKAAVAVLALTIPVGVLGINGTRHPAPGTPAMTAAARSASTSVSTASQGQAGTSATPRAGSANPTANGAGPSDSPAQDPGSPTTDPTTDSTTDSSTTASSPAAPSYQAAQLASRHGSAGPLVTIDTLRVLGPVTHVGQGFLHSLSSNGSDVQWFDALGATGWRSSIDGSQLASSNSSGWSTTQKDAVPTTLILSDMWSAANGGTPVAPWSDWSRYRLWVEATVLEAKAEGYRIDYWEVYNEPDDLTRYYSPGVYSTVTPDLLLQQFLVADQAITAVDGSAQIVGPSLATFDTPTTSRTFSMTQFLTFTASQHIRLAALSWHHARSASRELVHEAQEARIDLARYPQVATPQLFVNEYGSAVHQRIPGWDLADLVSLNDSGVDQANRSCWFGDCVQSSLDGLLTPDGAQALPDYWVRLDYAGMKGVRVRAMSNSRSVYSLAAFDPAGATLTAIVGRAVGCAQDPRCPARYADAAPVTVTVSIQVPWSSGTAVVDEQRISGRSITPTSRPAVSAATAPIIPSGAGGRVVVALTNFDDGDAEALSLNLAQ